MATKNKVYSIIENVSPLIVFELNDYENGKFVFEFLVKQSNSYSVTLLLDKCYFRCGRMVGRQFDMEITIEPSHSYLSCSKTSFNNTEFHEVDYTDTKSLVTILTTQLKKYLEHILNDIMVYNLTPTNKKYLLALYFNSEVSIEKTEVNEFTIAIQNYTEEYLGLKLERNLKIKEAELLTKITSTSMKRSIQTLIGDDFEIIEVSTDTSNVFIKSNDHCFRINSSIENGEYNQSYISIYMCGC